MGTGWDSGRVIRIHVREIRTVDDNVEEFDMDGRLISIQHVTL